MQKRTTKVDKVLTIVGIVIIVLSALGGLIILAMTADNFSMVAAYNAISSVFPAITIGTLLIGFAAIIRLLDQIRWQGEIMLKHFGEAPDEDSPAIGE